MLSAKEVLNKLQTGCHCPGDSGSPMDKKPDWLEMEKFHRGRRVFLNHPFSVSSGSGVGVYWMSQVPSLTTPVLFTKNSSTIPKARRRLLGTLKHIYHWYSGDVWNSSDEAYRSIECVRNMHKHVSRRMNNNASGMNDATRTTPWVTQYDMALTQFSFMGATILYPEKLGLMTTDEDMMCLIHFWAGIGYLLGIEDRFNLGLQCCCLEDYRSLFREIVERVVKPTLLESKVELEELLFRGSQAYRLEVDPFGEYVSLMHFTFEMVDVPVTVPSGWATTICRTARSAMVAYVNTPVIGRMINAYTLYVHTRASQSQSSWAKRAWNGILKSLQLSSE